MPDEIPVKAVRTTFEILQTLSRHGTLTFSDLVERLDQPKSTVYDHLQSLKFLGYVHETDAGYQISFEFLLIGDRRRSNTELFANARSELDELAAKTGEHISLLVEENGKGRTIYTIQGENSIDFKVYDGAQSQLVQTAPGQAVLANLPHERIVEILDENGLSQNDTGINRGEFLDTLETVRDQGFAIDEQNAIHGMNGIGVPIVDKEERVQGALSVYGPVGRMGRDRMRGELVEKLQQKANIIELNLDFSR